MKFNLTLVFFLFLISACRKDESHCSDFKGITIAFADSKFQFDEEGYPIFWSDDNTDSQIEWEYDQNQFIRSKNGSFYSGLGWNSFSFNWSGDTCIVTVVAEGVPDAIDTIIVNANRDVLSYRTASYYYTDNRLDSIINPPTLDSYFEYESDRLVAVKSYYPEGGNPADNHLFTYDVTGRLIQEIKLIASQPLWKRTTKYRYNSEGQLSTISQVHIDTNGEIVKNYHAVNVTQLGCGLPLPMNPINRYRYSYLDMRPVIFN